MSLGTGSTDSFKLTQINNSLTNLTFYSLRHVNRFYSKLEPVKCFITTKKKVYLQLESLNLHNYLFRPEKTQHSLIFPGFLFLPVLTENSWILEHGRWPKMA